MNLTFHLKRQEINKKTKKKKELFTSTENFELKLVGVEAGRGLNFNELHNVFVLVGLIGKVVYVLIVVADQVAAVVYRAH